jgi:predicted transcriptional regulator
MAHHAVRTKSVRIRSEGQGIISPNKKSKVDTVTSEKLLDIIEAKFKEIDEAVTELRSIKD